MSSHVHLGSNKEIQSCWSSSSSNNNSRRRRRKLQKKSNKKKIYLLKQLAAAAALQSAVDGVVEVGLFFSLLQFFFTSPFSFKFFFSELGCLVRVVGQLCPTSRLAGRLDPASDLLQFAVPPSSRSSRGRLTSD